MNKGGGNLEVEKKINYLHIGKEFKKEIALIFPILGYLEFKSIKIKPYFNSVVLPADDLKECSCFS